MHRAPSTQRLSHVARAHVLALALALASGCQRQAPEGGPAPGSAGIAAAPAPFAPAATATPAAGSSSPPSAAPPSRPTFAELTDALSEPDGKFFSDNYVSNETSYLQVARDLARRAKPGGAYIGVGPEQNFTYIAHTRPSIAFIVDIRRDNLLLHLLYKALFDVAESRAHFLASLVGRPWTPEGDPGKDASIDAVVAHAERLPPSEAYFSELHGRLRDRIENAYGVKLDGSDRRTLELTHRTFFQRQLDIRFELKEKNGRVYPSLRELLAARGPDGERSGFLATEEAFRFVQDLSKRDRIVPVVGDFAGDRAMPGVARRLAEEGLVVSAFYVSNVEQYLFEPGVWARWARNVAALPIDDESLFIRAYLDQGKRHPKQLAGHRTATTLHKIADFNARQAKKPYASFWSVATEGVL